MPATGAMPRAVRVAVIDDFTVFRDALAALLDEEPGYLVVGTGTTAHDAVEVARAQRPDVMLLDYHLPGGPAHIIVTAVLAHSPATRIVMLTADTSADARSRSLVAGAHGFVTKDQGLDRVLEAIARATAPV